VLQFDEFDIVISYVGVGGCGDTNSPHRSTTRWWRFGRFDLTLTISVPDEVGRA
jgi:hypothetical protein